MSTSALKPAKILVVDDDRTWQVYLFSLLQHGFELRSAYTGDTALDIAVEFLPECILLDVTMPGKSGYEVCRQLKRNSVTSQIPIIFLSSKSSMQEKVLGFELGADDYLVKTTEAEVLKAKIARAVQQSRTVNQLNQSVVAAQSAAFEAMSGSADLGCCLRFVERTYLMDSHAKLAEGIFRTMDEFGLRCSLMIITPDAPLFFSSSEQDVSPLEREMFIATHAEGRFCDFGNRTFCNYKLISLLIKNMPMDNPERYGRIKDAVPWILGTADCKAAVLNSKSDILQKLLLAQTNVDAVRSVLEQQAVLPQRTRLELIDQLKQVQMTCEFIDNQLRREAETTAPNTELGADDIYSSGIDFF